MLSIFEPNINFPWLGEMKQLGPAYELPSNPYQYDLKENAEDTPFPVAPTARRSYHAQSNAVWIKSSGLQVMWLFEITSFFGSMIIYPWF